MATRAWERAGWTVFGAAVTGIAAYMVSVGWNQASLVAGVVGFFVAVAGLALAVAAHTRAVPQGSAATQVGVTADGNVRAEIARGPEGSGKIIQKDVQAKGSVTAKISSPDTRTRRGTRSR